MAEWLQKPFSKGFIKAYNPPLSYGVYCSECGYSLEEVVITEHKPNYVDAGNAAVFLPTHVEYEYPDVCPCCKYIMRG